MKLYLVKLECKTTKELFYKIGVTQHYDTAKRFVYGDIKVVESDLQFRDKVEKIMEGQKYIPNIKYDVEVLFDATYTHDGDALRAERDLLMMVGKFKYKPLKHFSGTTECFRDENILPELKKYMADDSKERNEAAPSLAMYKLAKMGMKRVSDPIEMHELVLAKCKEMMSN